MRRALAERLERGAGRSGPARWLARTWARNASVKRRLALPSGANVIGVAGATLGGSYKTPVVHALARELSSRRRVAVVGHGYGARPGPVHRVAPDSPVARAGDDALWLARALGPTVPVFVGRSRAAALAAAATTASIVIVDSLLQTRPERLALSILVGDGRSPWGSGACPPVGDLRAPVERLLDAADVGLWNGPLADSAAMGETPVFLFASRIHGARLSDGTFLSVADLCCRKIGLVLAIARPFRVIEALTALGVRLARIELFGDHEVPSERRVGPPVDLWLSTAKCATKLQPSYNGAPVAALEHRLTLPPDLLRAVCSLGQDPC